ncbi:MAG TPA: hypothetical protein VFV28_07095, partial [Limnobacter sp.]|nr:hypothetical protein [Limnobacter sp.]
MPIINQCFSKLCCGKPDERAVVDNQNAPRAQAVYQVANQHIQQASPVLAAAPQIPAPASTSASTSASAPAHNYLLDGSVPIHNLVTFADDPRFPQVDKILLAEELALRLHDPALTAKTRFDLCASLVKTLTPGMTVIYAERKRGDSFFANMAVDIFVANPGLEKSRITKNRFVDLVSRWLNEIAPDRQSFSVQGAQISRDAMQQWLLEAKA